MNLQLSLKKKWFQMTKTGVKTEDYREINDYWSKRLVMGLWHEEGGLSTVFLPIEKIDYHRIVFKIFTVNTITLGYPKSTDKDKILKLAHKGIEIRTGDPKWGAKPNQLYFVIKHGN
jgi:hypothetical protein